MKEHGVTVTGDEMNLFKSLNPPLHASSLLGPTSAPIFSQR
jgi:hypothetical protein